MQYTNLVSPSPWNNLARASQRLTCTPPPPPGFVTHKVDQPYATVLPHAKIQVAPSLLPRFVTIACIDPNAACTSPRHNRAGECKRKSLANSFPPFPSSQFQRLQTFTHTRSGGHFISLGWSHLRHLSTSTCRTILFDNISTAREWPT